MDWRHLPSLGSLRAFVSVAEKKSFSAAGRDLNVTHAAVSQQVRALEAHLGLQLVVREGRGIALTPEGEALFDGVRDGFGRITETIDSLVGSDDERPLHVTMTPSFAVSWLMPRISDFKVKHPEVELVLNPTAEPLEFTPGGVDLAIRYGSGNWPALESELLLASNYVVIGAECLVGEKTDYRPEDLLEFHWLQELGTNEMAMWLKSQGVVLPERLNVTHLPGYMVLEGLRRGDGITATARVFVEGDIEAGNLRVLFEDIQPLNAGYHLVTRPGVQRPALKAFLSWIRQKAREAKKTAAS